MSKGARENAGEVIGDLLAPLVASASRARQARMFHPDGQTFIGSVEAIPGDGPLACMGATLAGHALVRFSGALWRRGFPHLDVLGVAMRLRSEPISDTVARPDDQDLLFATIMSPFTMPFAPLTTDAGDFAANHYWAVSPFDAPGIGRVKFRLSPGDQPHASKLSREESLASNVAQHLSSWTLSVRRTFSLPWTPVARLTLTDEAHVDQAALRFSPFQCGRGIVPRGLVHAIRRPTYAASQAARPAH